MQVVVRPRQGGKTTAIIKWLLAGSPKDAYPGWSRVIVCMNSQEVLRLTKLVMDATKFWPNKNAAKDVRKAIWSPADLEYNLGQGRYFEYGIDNLDMFLGISPSIVTMTGELYDE